MFKSLKARMLLTGSILFVVIAASAIYGRLLFEETIVLGIENTQKYQRLNRIIVGMKYPLTALQGSTYKYLTSLNNNDQITLLLHLKELQEQLSILKTNPLSIQNTYFSKNTQNIAKLINQLDQKLKRLSQFSSEERYPITQIIASTINPNNSLFFASLQVLENSVETLKQYDGMQNIEFELQNIKYIITQIFSATRLLFVSKTGIFGGSPEDTITTLISNYQQYARYLNQKINYLLPLLELDDLDLDIEEAINNLVRAKNERNSSIEKIISRLKAKDWRADVYYVDQEISPLFEKIIGEFNLIERRLEQITNKNILKTKSNSETLSGLLLIYTGITLLIFLASYWAMEHWIRIPLIKISNALHFERHQVQTHNLKEIGLKEIDRVISAFNYMSKEIKTRQLRLAYILKNAGEAIILADHDGCIDSFNSTAENIFKVSESQARTLNISELIEFPDFKKDLNWLAENQNNTQHLNYFLDAQRSNDEHFKCDVTLSLMILNESIYGIVVARDATARLQNEQSLKQAKEQAESSSEQLQLQLIQLDRSIKELKSTQKQLIESEKNASLGSLVAGVAHEINTPIGVGVTASSLLTQEVKNLQHLINTNQITKQNLNDFLADASEASEIIDSNLKRASELVKSFKMVAVDQQSDENRKINLKEYIDDIILSLRPKLKKYKHTIEVSISEKIIIFTSPGAISQIFTNFIMNSLIHGFENIASGTITINAKVNQDELIIIYGDNGVGMTQEQVKHVFEPFFTNKRGEGGSGLGMHIVYNLVTQNLKGQITCTSDTNAGCQFKLIIPLSENTHKA